MLDNDLEAIWAGWIELSNVSTLGWWIQLY